MSKDNIVSLIQGFTIELNPKVRFKLNSIPLDSKNHIYITYLPVLPVPDCACIIQSLPFITGIMPIS